MYAHAALEIFARHLIKGADLDNTGVVDEDINLTVVGEDLLHCSLDLGTIEQVTGDRQDFAAARAQLRSREGPAGQVLGRQSAFGLTSLRTWHPAIGTRVRKPPVLCRWAAPAAVRAIRAPTASTNGSEG